MPDNNAETMKNAITEYAENRLSHNYAPIPWQEPASIAVIPEMNLIGTPVSSALPVRMLLYEIEVKFNNDQMTPIFHQQPTSLSASDSFFNLILQAVKKLKDSANTDPYKLIGINKTYYLSNFFYICCKLFIKVPQVSDPSGSPDYLKNVIDSLVALDQLEELINNSIDDLGGSAVAWVMYSYSPEEWNKLVEILNNSTIHLRNYLDQLYERLSRSPSPRLQSPELEGYVFVVNHDG